MLRIIHYVPNLNCTSGITNMLMNYYRNIDRTKIQFDFIYFMNNTKNNFCDEIKSLGGNICHIDPPTHYSNFKKQLKDYLKKLNKNNKYVFHNHQLAFTILLYPIIKKEKNIVFIVHNHMTKYSDKKISSIRNYILSIPIKYMNKIHIFACSNEAAQLIIKNKKRDYYIMDNGINIRKYLFDETIRNKVRKNLKITNNYVIGHIGRFEKVKNHEFILEVFEKILLRYKSAVLLLIGTGNEEQHIRNIIIEKGITNSVIILQNRKDVNELLMAMDTFIFPSRFEGLGISAIEAQASGLPVVMSDKIPNIVNICNVDVLSLDVSAEEWANHLLKNKIKNRKKCNSIIANTRFNIDKNVSDIEELYYKISNIE